MSCDVRIREIPVNLFDVTGVHVTKCCQLTDAVFVMLMTFTFTEDISFNEQLHLCTL